MKCIFLASIMTTGSGLHFFSWYIAYLCIIISIMTSVYVILLHPWWSWIKMAIWNSNASDNLSDYWGAYWSIFSCGWIYMANYQLLLDCIVFRMYISLRLLYFVHSYGSISKVLFVSYPFHHLNDSYTFYCFLFGSTFASFPITLYQYSIQVVNF